MTGVEQTLEQLEATAIERIGSAADSRAVEELRVQILGKKGELTAVLRTLGSLPASERSRIGATANALKERIAAAFADRLTTLERQRLEALAESEWVDVTFIPAGSAVRGHLHPVTQTLGRIREIFSRIGYSVATGPEVEDEFFNFEALNIPAGHPARDTMDSFFVGDGEFLLRTHTSPVQIRYMREHQPPIRIIAPGRVFRRDYDATHLPEFHQVEGLCVDDDIRLSDLKGTIEYFCRSMFGADRRIRIVGDHFPFTEPSVGAAVSCGLCGGKGCRSCKAGWLEIMGAGMVHPQVLRNGGIDPSRYTGFAFGMGIDRIAMLLYGVPDIRLFFDNDVRFLHQF
jgi:phenylalanyl-tRNA synthetase alpha chain